MNYLHVVIVLGWLVGVFPCIALPLQVQSFTFTPVPSGSDHNQSQATLSITATGGTPPIEGYTYKLGSHIQTGASAMFTLPNYNVFVVQISDGSSTELFEFASQLFDVGVVGPLKYDIGPITGTLSGPDSSGNLKLTLKTDQSEGKINNISVITQELYVFPHPVKSMISSPITPGDVEIDVVPDTSLLSQYCNSTLSFFFSNPNLPLSISTKSIHFSIYHQ
jgi:hypothetical protein